MTTSLTPELRARLDAHLDSVDRNLLATAHTREQRRAITDDLESQILEMLAARSPTPTLADLVDFIKLTQMQPELDTPGGNICEPDDVPLGEAPIIVAPTYYPLHTRQG